MNEERLGPLTAICFSVRGLPAPQGDLKAGIIAGHAHLYHRSSGPLGDWRHAIASAAQPFAPKAPWDGPVSLVLRFRLPLPKSRPTTAGRGKEKHRIRVYPDRRPDVDKLIRAVLDSLTHVIFADDSQVVRITASKDYGAPGVQVTVRRILENGGR